MTDMVLPKVYVVGAGGFGREVFGWAQQHPACGQAWDLAGFLDDATDQLTGKNFPGEVLGCLSGHSVEQDAYYLCGLGQPDNKQRLLPDLVRQGARFLTLVHPSCVLGPQVKLGIGVVLCPQVVLTANIEIGDFSMLNTHVTAGHDVRVGQGCTISSFCDLTGGVTVGDGVFLASRVTVVPGRTVGDGAYVGVGSVVLQNVRPRQRVFGVPARPL